MGKLRVPCTICGKLTKSRRSLCLSHADSKRVKRLPCPPLPLRYATHDDEPWTPAGCGGWAEMGEETKR